KFARLRPCVFVEHSCLRHIALTQTHAFTVFQIDRGKYNHGVTAASLENVPENTGLPPGFFPDGIACLRYCPGQQPQESSPRNRWSRESAADRAASNNRSARNIHLYRQSCLRTVCAAEESKVRSSPYAAL